MRRIFVVAMLLVAVFVFAQQKDQQQPQSPKRKGNVPAQQDTTPVSTSRARISFDSESFNFGFAPQGNGYLVHSFMVKNLGEDTLIIERVRPTCGCTAAPLKKSNLAPGEITEITSIFRLSGYKGATTKSIKVESNDPTHIAMSLTFNANMDSVAWLNAAEGPRIFSNPGIVDLGKGDLFQRKSRTTIKSGSDKKLNLKIMEYTRDIIQEPTLKNTTIKPNASIDVEFNVLDTFNKDDELKASITIAGIDETGSEVTRITVPIIGGGKQ